MVSLHKFYELLCVLGYGGVLCVLIVELVVFSVVDMRVGEIAAPHGRCTPILLVPSLFHVELRGTKEVYDDKFGNESMDGSLSVSSMEQVVGVRCLGNRGGEMGDGGFVFDFFLRIGKLRVSERGWCAGVLFSDGVTVNRTGYVTGAVL